MGGVHTVPVRDEDRKIFMVQLAEERWKLDSWECFSKATVILQDIFWQDVEPDGLAVSNGAPQSGAMASLNGVWTHSLCPCVLIMGKIQRDSQHSSFKVQKTDQRWHQGLEVETRPWSTKHILFIWRDFAGWEVFLWCSQGSLSLK